MVRACLRVRDLMGSCVVAIGIILAYYSCDAKETRDYGSGSSRQFHRPADRRPEWPRGFSLGSKLMQIKEL